MAPEKGPKNGLYLPGSILAIIVAIIFQILIFGVSWGASQARQDSFEKRLDRQEVIIDRLEDKLDIIERNTAP